MRNWFLSACLLLSLMSGRNGPPPWVQGRPQQGTFQVATSPPSVTDAPDADDAAAASAASDASTTATLMAGSATTAVNPRFLYPQGDGLEINSLDEIEVQYETSWADLTLSITCKGDGVGGTKSFDVALSMWSIRTCLRASANSVQKTSPGKSSLRPSTPRSPYQNTRSIVRYYYKLKIVSRTTW
jgi:hypothetical protein